MNLEIVKKHPVIAGAVLFGGVVILYLLMKHGSSAAATGNAGVSDAQLQATSTAEGLAAAQYNSQLQMAQISGQVASEQTQAQLAAVKLETDSAQNIVSTQTSGAVQQTQIQADSTTEVAQINADAQTDIAHSYFNTALAATQANINAKSQVDMAVITAAARDKSRSSTGYAQIISALEGLGPEAIAANQPAVVSSNNQVGNIISGITKGIFGLF